jgi:dodecin
VVSALATGVFHPAISARERECPEAEGQAVDPNQWSGRRRVPASCFGTEWEDDMPDSVYDVILLVGSSKESWEKAAANAVEQAAKSLRNLRVAEIVELDMQLDAKGKVEAYRAKVRLSFKIER